MVTRALTVIWAQAILTTGWMLLGPAAAAADVPTLDGVWRSDGYGLLLEVDGKRLRAYEVTAISCIPSWTAARLEEKKEGVEAVFKLESQGPKLYVTAGPSPDTRYFGMTPCASRILARRLSERADLTKKPADTPLANFDVFWTTFSEHYPFFALHGMDWQAVRNKYRPRVTAEPSRRNSLPSCKP
jgi:hypothetical protein